jgi:hypothetical protein
MMNDTRFLRRADAARYVREKWGLPCAPRTLAKIACLTSDGPVFRLAGRFPLYDPKDLDEWAQSRIGQPQRSTSDKTVDIPKRVMESDR